MSIYTFFHPRTWTIGLHIDAEYTDFIEVIFGFGPFGVVIEWRNKEYR